MIGPIRAAVIGVGAMGRHHARVYRELPETALVGVADRDRELARVAGEQHHVNHYRDAAELLERERPEVVSIVVPTGAHRATAELCMEAGVAVLIEKPIAGTIEDAEALIASAERLGQPLMVGHIVRYNAAIQAMRARLAKGELGRIIQIVCRRVGPFPSRIRDVGVVIDLATHDLDLMRFLSGEEPSRVYAETEQQIHTAHEDMMVALLRFPSGVTGLLETNWLTPYKTREVMVLGTKGMFRVDDLSQDLFFYENLDSGDIDWNQISIMRGVSEGRMIRYPIQREEPLRAELHDFVTAYRDGRPMPITGADGLAALRLALALIEAGERHQVVDLTGAGAPGAAGAGPG